MVDKENFDEAAQIADELQSRREVPVDVHAAWLRFVEYYAPEECRELLREALPK